MGGWDYYCAICGGPFSSGGLSVTDEDYERDDGGNVDHDSDDEEENYDSDDEEEVEPIYAYSQDIFQRGKEDPKFLWLGDVRAMGVNRDVTRMSQVWVSGPAKSMEFGVILLQLGDDPHPALESMDDLDLRVYEGPDGVIPFHVACRELLCRHIGITLSELDNDVLYQTFNALNDECEYNRSLPKVDYGEIEDHMDQYWGILMGTEHLVSNPVEVTNLAEFSSTLPHRDTNEAEAQKARLFDISGDPFAYLPTEVIILLMSRMDLQTLLTMRKASPVFNNIELTNGFWRSRIAIDMPWLWEHSSLPPHSEVIDWRTVYHDLLRRSSPECDKRRKFYGLCNRRRIWEQILPSFTNIYRKKQPSRSGAPAILIGASTSRTHRLIQGTAADNCHTVTETLVNSFNDVDSADPCLRIEWTEAGDLAAIRIEQSSLHNEKGSTSLGRNDFINITANGWISGFIFTIAPALNIEEKGSLPTRRVVGAEVLHTKTPTTKQLGSAQGEKILVYVSRDCFIVGLTTQQCSRGRLYSIALLQQDIRDVDRHGREVDEYRTLYNQFTIGKSWCRQLPSSGLAIGKAISGYSTRKENQAMESLVWGTKDAQLDDILSISCDIQFGGFEVLCKSGVSHSIGPKHLAMKTLTIDGPGGERIVDVWVSVEGLPRSIRFITNRGRHLLIGHPGSTEKRLEAGYPEAYDPGMFCGIYGWWEEQPSGTLEVMGPFKSATLINTNPQLTVDDLPKDENGWFWTPTFPPSDLIETGPIWGERDNLDLQRPQYARAPGEGCVVTWLDCSKPLSEVRVTLVHSTNSMKQVPLSAITFKYQDGEEGTVGPDRFPMEPTCGWCEYGYSIKEEVAQVPHYRHDTWKVDGRKLTSLRLWRSELGNVAAIQMIVEGGLESPIWGHWGYDTSGEEASSLDFEQEAVALKVFFQNNDRQVSRDDSIVVALQAMERKNGVAIR